MFEKFHEELNRIKSAEETAKRVRLMRALDDSGPRGLLDAPCIFCGYNGTGYWQKGTHSPSCAFHDLGGEAERALRMSALAQKDRNKFLRAICDEN